jgi:DNA polymerase-3 subunit gamma/tau
MAHATRAWQMLLKGLGEVRLAPVPVQAAEMLLIRLCYAAGLPTPAEALACLGDGGAGGRPPAAPPAGTPPPGGSRPQATAVAPAGASRASALRHDPPAPGAANVGGSGGGGVAAPDRSLTARDQPVAAAPAGRLRSFADVVDLVREAREAILHGHLIADVRLVRFAHGHIELNLLDAAPGDLPQRLSRLLSESTGERWLVTVSREDGQPSLHEQQRTAEARRLEEIADHPLIRAIFAVFPGATIDDVRSAPVPAGTAEGTGAPDGGDGADNERE